MAVIMSKNRINVRPGDRCFVASSNLCDFFQIGDNSTSYLLIAEMIGPDKEFLFNGRLFLPGHTNHGTVIDNFPKAAAPQGWVKRQRIATPGYELVDPSSDIILFGFEEIDNVCHVIANVYDESGVVIAETLADNFIVHRPPAIIGTGGIHIG
jgi:hypothetical protein